MLKETLLRKFAAQVLEMIVFAANIKLSFWPKKKESLKTEI
jgi:hypothetical protein